LYIITTNLVLFVFLVYNIFVMNPSEGADIPKHHTVVLIEGSDQNVAAIVEELGAFAAASQNIVGITVESHADADATAFTGGHRVNHNDDYSTLTVALNTHEGIRSATRLLIPESRLAEIADAYVLPEHLKNPSNHVDAYIGHVIKGLTGYTEDNVESMAEQAEASTDTIAVTPGLNDGQTEAIRLYGTVNLLNAQLNVLYRAQQVETMEHVLRFLIARENSKSYMHGNFYSSLDYDWATGILGEALEIVNGKNGFNKDPDPSTNDLLYRGTLAQKSSIAVLDRVVQYSGIHGPVPIWPPEAVAAHEAEQLEIEAARQTAAKEQSIQYAAELAIREAEQANRRAAERQYVEAIKRTVDSLLEEGFVWRGTMPITPSGPMNSAHKIQAYYMEQHGLSEQDVRVLDGVAIHGGTKIYYSAGEVTIYLRQQDSSQE
jgi:hypothetical protein